MNQWELEAGFTVFPSLSGDTAPPRLSHKTQHRFCHGNTPSVGIAHTWRAHSKTELKHLRPPTNTQFLHEMLKISTVWQKGWRYTVRLFLTEQTPYVTATELRQLIPGMNVMWLLGVGDVCFSESAGSSLPERPQKMHLCSCVDIIFWETFAY